MEVTDDLSLAIVNVHLSVDGAEEHSARSLIELFDPSEQPVGQATVVSGQRHRFIVKNPRLWYPLGYGKQPLYVVKARLVDGADTASKRIGLRLCELVQRPIPGEDGLTFFFRINNVPIYSQGTDWIPPDVFLPRMTHDRYRKWLTMAAKGNQNMIRVWGGGIYEEDVFYDLCDELGILIWQDFMMGCGAYPYHKYLEDTIRKEADYNVRRMRHHPCIVLWCGNNEDYMFAEIHKLEYDMNDHNPDNWIKSNFPGRYYYEVVLKEVAETLSPRVPYHLSSPYGGTHSNSPLQGDIHSWRVWMADQPRYPYQDYEKLTGRFVSEFGMKSFPCSRTINALITDPDERHPQSKTMDAWHMAPEDQRTLSMYLIDNVRHENDLDSYAWATQLIQAESTDYSSRAFRRLWRGPGKEECAGCLIWQLNDCFPAVSWSLLDSNVRPKLAYYVTKRNYEPLLVGATRRVKETKRNEFTHVDIVKEAYVEVWASNFRLDRVEANLEVAFVSINGGKHIQSYNSVVELAPNRSSELERVPFPDAYQANPSALVASVRLLEKGSGRVLARYVEFPQPLRHNDYSAAKVSVRPVGNLSWAVSVTGGVGKAVELYVDTANDEVADACTFSDNCLNIVPGDEQEVTVEVGNDAKTHDLVIKERHYC